MKLPEPPFDVQVFFQPGNPNNHLSHVIANVEGILVCKQWSRRKQDWYYACERPEYFTRMIEQGFATIRGGKQ